MKTTISITEARKKIFQIAQDVQKPGSYYFLTEKGRSKAVVMSADEFDSIMETIDILSDPKILKDIKQAEKEYERGEYQTLDEVLKEFGYEEKEITLLRDKAEREYKTSKTKK